MLTWTFFSDKKNRLCVRLRNNGKKAQLCLFDSVKDKALIEALGSLSVGRTQIKIRLNYYISILSQIRNELTMAHAVNTDVTEIRDRFAERIGIATYASAVRGEFERVYSDFVETKTGGTRRVYEHTWSRLEAFVESRCTIGIDKLTFEDVNLGWLERFEAYLAETASKNARNIHLRNIRAVFNYALDHEMDISYPFRRFKIRPEETRKRSLPVEDLRELIAMETEDYAELYRDMFVLSFMLIGINMADLYKIERIENGRIEYRRAKTHRLYSIKVEPEAMAIIERWRGRDALLCIADRWTDHRNFVHQCNLALQKLGMTYTGKRGAREGESRWPGLSTYWARHTWSTIAYNKCKIPKDVISQALGHASGSKTTEIYLDKDQSLVDEANRRVLDYVLYNKL